MQKNKLIILAQSIFPREAKRRVAVVATAFGWAVAVAATGTVQTPELVTIPLATVIESLALAPKEQDGAGAHVYAREERLERGDTIAALLARLGVDPAEAAQLSAAHSKSKAFRMLRPGMSVFAQTTEYGALLNLRFVSGRETLLGFERDGERFRAVEEKAAVTRQVAMRSGVIRSSLFAATDEADVPDGVATQIAEIFGGDMDFHRDLRRGDRFAVVYETFYHNGRPLKSGRVLAAEFVNGKKTLRAVWFEDEDGGSYYAPDGNSLRKAFLRSPLEFSRITSGFAARINPISQQWQVHKGVDYAAPTGTRVRATGDATVDFAGQQGGYGNLVILRHRGSVTTFYAHLSGFGDGVRKGARVAQGETIGFVGTTGWSTGPHLHYEFRVNDHHQNPLTIAMPAAEPVPAQRLAAFHTGTQVLATRLDLLQNASLAALE